MTEELRGGVAILRRKQVQSRTGLARSTIYEKIATGEFPAPIRLGVRAVGWIETEVRDWLNSRVRASREGSERS